MSQLLPIMAIFAIIGCAAYARECGNDRIAWIGLQMIALRVISALVFIAPIALIYFIDTVRWPS